MSSEWYCQRGGTRLGPFSIEQMRQAYLQGQLHDYEPVWTPGMETWLPVSAVRERFQFVDAPSSQLNFTNMHSRAIPAIKPGSRTPPLEMHDRILRALFVALAVGLAWGIRGSFGHILGAMYPGAVLGLGFAYVSGQDALLRRMPLIAAVSAVGIGLGGNMSYGLLHGYAQADTFVNSTFGMLMLFLCGGAWGFFGSAAVGLLLERDRATVIDWAGGVAISLGFGLISWLILHQMIGFDVNPGRSNSLITFVGGVLGLTGWLMYRKRFRALRAGLLGFAGFGIGMAGGRLLANAARNMETMFQINHWNVMEVTAGAVGGFVFVFGMLGRQYPDHSKNGGVTAGQALSAAFVLGMIPLLHRLTRVTARRIDEWNADLLKHGSSWDGENIAAALTVIAACALVAAAVWLYLIWAERDRMAWYPVMALTVIMLVFQNFFARYFFTPAQPNFVDMHNFYWFALVVMAAYVGWREYRGGHTGDGEHEEAPEPVGWIPICAVMLVGLLVCLAGAAVVNGEHTMKNAETRWPIWSFRDGPFPGSQ